MEVVAVYPPPDDRDSPAHTPIVVITSRPVDPASLTAETFSLTDTSGQDVPGEFDFLVFPPGFLFAPTSTLTPGAGYNVNVSAFVVDGDGNPLRADVSYSFFVAS
jgi:hypothetical protein